jgi:hypothetical protein
MARKRGKRAGGHWNNRLADMSLPAGDRADPKTTRTSRLPVPAQMQRGNTPAGRRKRRDGERAMERERLAADVPDAGGQRAGTP